MPTLAQFSNSFKEDCIAWLSPLGYSLSESSIGRLTKHTFFNPADVDAPEITCYDNGESKWCECTIRGPLYLFITITTGKLTYKHPEIKRYISYLTHYAKLCRANKPQ